MPYPYYNFPLGGNVGNVAGFQTIPPVQPQIPPSQSVQPMPQYQPQPYQPMQPTAQTQQQTQGGILWVTEEQAEAYQPTSGTPVALWVQDKDAHSIYIKSLDSMGKPTTVILDYQERTQGGAVQSPAPAVDVSAFALKSGLDALRAEIQPVMALVRGKREKREEGNEQ